MVFGKLISSVLPLRWLGAENDQGPFRLLDLPQDIVERVIGLALPLDIVSLRKTCKALSSLSAKQWIWLEVATTIAEERDMLLPQSFFNSMSIRDLENFACAPFIYVHRLQLAGRGEAPITAALKFQLRPRRLHSLPKLFLHAGHNPVTNLTLVSGGQYLLANSEALTNSTIRLLRLFNSTEGAIQTPELAVLSLQGNHRLSDHWTLRQRRGVLRIVVLERILRSAVDIPVLWETNSEFGATSESRIAIFDVDTTAAQPEFALVARTSEQLPVPFERSAVSHCDEDRVVFCGARAIAIWDFTRDSVLTLDLENPSPPYTIKVLQNRVVYFHCLFVAVYLLPDNASGHLGLLTPTYKLPHHQWGNITYVFFSSAPPTSNEPLFYHTYARKSKTIRTYELPLGASAPISHSPRAVRYASEENRSSHDPWGIHPAPYTTIGNTHVVARLEISTSPGIVWLDMGNASSTNGPLERRRSSVSIGYANLSLWESFPNMGIQAMTFDTATGRACATDIFGHLHVADYADQTSVSR
ncbi:uncharacterized protein SCHCODRAFT_02679102 [Schizophyllum commune H4-8]|nr:uncharacterized protein SCHCODRAFT_02679102 [Schizophyllum commune H4-8]KAI5891790.1 hypothetical protein SCHCODRAFT_02679102 [Schizophyllum commune H4-8]